MQRNLHKNTQKLQNKKHCVVWTGCVVRVIFVTCDVCVNNNSCKCPHDNTHHIILGEKLKVQLCLELHAMKFQYFDCCRLLINGVLWFRLVVFMEIIWRFWVNYEYHGANPIIKQRCTYLYTHSLLICLVVPLPSRGRDNAVLEFLFCFVF